MSGSGPMTGRVFGGRYEIGERIGIGGMAEVYIAQDTVLGRVVAVKVMLSQYAGDEEFTRRFRQEAAAAANLQSPYIVNVYDWGHDDDTYFIVMEYVRGSDLKTAIQTRGAINQRKVAEIGVQVCQALSVAHSQDIMHRDIKPQNIMVQPDGNVKVMDFGIARAKNSTADKTQTVLGTAHYTSPEQAQGKDLTSASDIYSLGVVLYEAATGTLPFDGPDAVSVALMQVRDMPPAPREINPDIDPALEAIIMRAMQKDPAARFATANDMRLALADYLAGRPVNLGNTFSAAKTSVIAPIGAGGVGAAGGGLGATQVMSPVSERAGGAGGAGGAMNYINDTQTPQKGSKKKVAVVAAIIAIVAIAAVCIGIFAFGGGNEKVEVPDVSGMTSAAAVDALEAAGLQVGTTTSAYDANVEAGKVIKQDPSARTQVAKNSKVNLTISQGSEQISVPTVTGMTQDAAKKAITEAGFTVGDTTTKNDSSVDKGSVISQSPSAGSKAAKGSKIDIVVSAGAEQVAVPDITNMTVEAARATAEAAGFTISQYASDYSDTVAAGNIMSQNPTSGGKADKGSTISYVLSLGTEQITVPDVVGYSQSGAQSAIAGAGLKYAVVEQASNSVAAGVVISQSVAGGSAVSADTVITITVSTGAASSASSATSSTAKTS